jgi:hypothetical protein
MLYHLLKYISLLTKHVFYHVFISCLFMFYVYIMFIHCFMFIHCIMFIHVLRLYHVYSLFYVISTHIRDFKNYGIIVVLSCYKFQFILSYVIRRF